MSVTIIVPGKPVPKGRPRVTKWGTFTPKTTVEYESRIKAAWEAASASPFPGGAPLLVDIVAYFEIPKSESKRKQAAMQDTPHIKRGDIDNVAKCCLDALNGLAFPDDGAVCVIRAEKRWAKNPHTDITVSLWEDKNGKE